MFFLVDRGHRIVNNNKEIGTKYAVLKECLTVKLWYDQTEAQFRER